MTTLNTVQKFALADTFIAKENVRADTAHDPDKIALLAGSIRHFGKLLEPLKAYIDADGKAAVWDGGRRWTALKLIEADGDGVGAVIIEAVDVFITTQDEASAASLATFVREDQHPADEFLAYNAKFDEGMTAEQIAAAFAVEAADVAKLLRFRTLAPEIFEAFRAGRFGLDVAFAFTLTTDQDKQRALLSAHPADKDFSAQAVKRALTEGAVTAGDKWARFIGREAYEAAGGTFLMDLFSQGRADEQWSNGDLVRELAQRKLRETEEAFLADGWSKVIVSQDSYGWQGGYTAMKAEGPTKKGKPREFTAEQKARGVVFIVFGWQEHEVKVGYEKAAKSKTTALPKPDQALYGWGHGGHHILTQVATDVTRYAIANNPEAAADALLVTLAWGVLHKPQWQHSNSHQMASNLGVDHRFSSRVKEGADVMGADLLAEDLRAWSDRLPKEMVAFCEAVAALGVADKMLLTAHCFAATIDGIEAQIGIGDADKRRHLGWMARHAKADVQNAWTPGYEFVKGGSKDALLGVITEVGNTPPGANAKKADLVGIVEHNALENGWRPQLLRNFMDVKDAEPKPKPTLGTAPADEGDATSEDEYLGWIASALVNQHGLDVEQAKETAGLALAHELADVEGGFGDPSYSWAESDAYASATAYLEAQDEEAEAATQLSDEAQDAAQAAALLNGGQDD